MSLWGIFDTLLDWLCHWRSNLFFWGSVILAGVVAANIPYEPLRWIVGGFIFLAGIAVGLRWDNSR